MGDHLTVMRGARSLVGRMLESGRHDAAAGLLERIAAELDAGSRTLSGFLRLLGASPPRSKLLAATIAERVGRAKLNGRIAENSPLSGLLELEALGAALSLVAAGWRSLRSAGIAVDDVVGGHADACERLEAELRVPTSDNAARVLAVRSGPVPR
jgi:UDP-glucose 4-epimerase